MCIGAAVPSQLMRIVGRNGYRYGVPGAYGVVTMPFSVREGINIFLAGFIPTENLRFRDMALTFKVSETGDLREEGAGAVSRFSYPSMKKARAPTPLAHTSVRTHAACPHFRAHPRRLFFCALGG